MDAWRGKDLGEPVQKLESGEMQRGAAGGIGLRQEVEYLVGTVADQVEAVEGEGRPSTRLLTVCWRPSRSSWVMAVASWKRSSSSVWEAESWPPSPGIFSKRPSTTTR